MSNRQSAVFNVFFVCVLNGAVHGILYVILQLFHLIILVYGFGIDNNYSSSGLLTRLLNVMLGDKFERI